MNRAEPNEMWKPWEAFDDHPGLLATYSEDGTVKVWNIHTGQQVKLYDGHPQRIHSFTLHGSLLVTGHDDGIARSWDPASGHRKRTFEGSGGPVLDAVLHHGLLATCSEMYSIHVWDAESGRLLRELEVGEGVPVSTIALHGDILATGLTNGSTKVWRAREGWHLQTFTAGPGHGAVHALTARSDMVAICPEHGELSLFDIQAGRKLSGLNMEDQKRCIVTALSLQGPLGGVLATGTDNGCAAVWDVRSGKKIRSFEQHTGQILSVQVRAGVLATGSEDKTAISWDVGTGKVLQVFKGHTGAVRTVAIANPTEP